MVYRSKKACRRGFIKAFSTTSGVVMALAVMFIGVPILACGGCLGLAMIFAPSEAELQEIQRKAKLASQNAVKETSAAEANKASEPPAKSLTMATYSRIQMGMTYEEVVEIIGPPEKELSSVELGGIRTVMLQWKGGFVANANMTFQNGKVVAKAQFGL